MADKDGKKTGGRGKGSRNKATVAREEGIAASGEMPLDYMLRVMRDPHADERRRDAMCAISARYLHSPKSSTLPEVPEGASVKIERIERVIIGVNAQK